MLPNHLTNLSYSLAFTHKLLKIFFLTFSHPQRHHFCWDVKIVAYTLCLFLCLIFPMLLSYLWREDPNQVHSALNVMFYSLLRLCERDYCWENWEGREYRLCPLVCIVFVFSLPTEEQILRKQKQFFSGLPMHEPQLLSACLPTGSSHVIMHKQHCQLEWGEGYQIEAEYENSLLFGGPGSYYLLPLCSSSCFLKVLF